MYICIHEQRKNDMYTQKVLQKLLLLLLKITNNARKQLSIKQLRLTTKPLARLYVKNCNI